jgi:hypothetical protein
MDALIITAEGMHVLYHGERRMVLLEKVKKSNHDEYFDKKRRFVLEHMKDGHKRFATAFKDTIGWDVLGHMIMIGLLEEVSYP